MTKILSPEEMAEDLFENHFNALYSIDNIDYIGDVFYNEAATRSAIIHVEYMIYLFLGEKSCAPIRGQGLVMDINYWIEVRNKLKEE